MASLTRQVIEMPLRRRHHGVMSPPTGAEVMAQFIPQSPFVAKLGIVAEVLDGDEVRLRMPWDRSS